MSPILQPQQDFPIVRQIANHTDATVYYVEAVVRDADGNILDSVRLVSQGDQRYQKRYRVPVDRSGSGAYISIITSVYTDAGYTTKSPNYGDEENTYLIFDRLVNRGGGSGGGNLEQGDIRRIIREELDKKDEEEDDTEDEVEAPEPIDIPRYDSELSSITTMLTELAIAVGEIPTEKVDIYPILEGIQNLAIAVDDKEVTPETDLEPVMDMVEEIADAVSKKLDEQNSLNEKNKEELKKTIIETIQDGMENTEFTQETMIRPKRMNRPKEGETTEPKTFNLKKFVS